MGNEAATSRLLQVIERGAGLAQAGIEARVSRHVPPDRLLAVAAKLEGLSWRHPEWQALVEPLLVHETYLFRDWAQLRHLQQTGLRELIGGAAAAARRLTIWSAGCSSGEEAYSLAALAQSALPQEAGWVLAVVGSDLSHDMVERARRGVFIVSGLSAFRAMPPQFGSFFLDCGPDHREVRADLKAQVRFTAGNLLEGPPPVAKADVVACRNVLIYMAEWARRAALERLSAAVAPGGFLLLGPTDQPPPSGQFEPVWGDGAVIYRRRMG